MHSLVFVFCSLYATTTVLAVCCICTAGMLQAVLPYWRQVFCIGPGSPSLGGQPLGESVADGGINETHLSEMALAPSVCLHGSHHWAIS